MTNNDALAIIDEAQEDVETPAAFISLRQLENMQRLVIQGYTEEEAERLSKPTQVELEDIMHQVMALQRKELRRLAKLSPKPKKVIKPKKRALSDDLTEIEFSGPNLPINNK